MSLSKFFVWMLLISGIIIGGRLLYTDLAETYGVTTNETFTAFDSYMNDTYEEIEDIEAKIEESKVTGIDAVDMAIYFVRGSYQALKLTLNIPSLYSNLIKEAVVLLKIPKWVETMVTGILAITVIFLIISAALKTKV